MNLLRRETNKYSAHKQARRAIKNRWWIRQRTSTSVLNGICWAMCVAVSSICKQRRPTAKGKRKATQRSSLVCLWVRRARDRRSHSNARGKQDDFVPTRRCRIEPWTRKLRIAFMISFSRWLARSVRLFFRGKKTTMCAWSEIDLLLFFRVRVSLPQEHFTACDHTGGVNIAYWKLNNHYPETAKAVSNFCCPLDYLFN